MAYIDVCIQILDFPLSMILDTALLPITTPIGLTRPLPPEKDLSQYKDWTILLSREPGEIRWQAQAIRAKVGSLDDFFRLNQEMSKEERLVPVGRYESKEAAKTAIQRLIDQRHLSPP